MKQLTRRENSQETLYDDPRESDYVHHMEANEGGNTTGLFSRIQLEAVERYNHVVVMDCTYKRTVTEYRFFI